MAKFKVKVANGDEMFIQATTGFVPAGEMRTRNTKAKVGDKVILHNGLGVRIEATRIPHRPKASENVQELFGNAFAEMRHSRGMTQQDVADIRGCSVGYVKAVENGTKNITAQQMGLFIKALGCKEIQIHIR